MERDRLAAFSDGVIAIIITIMVLELKVPHGTDFAALAELMPVFFSYVLSFVYVAIYWNNHHHMLHTAKHVTGGILWANTHLLFWLSLIPFSTAWMGENSFVMLPTALYGVILLCAGVAYYILQSTIVHSQGKHSVLARAIGHDIKGKMSPILYCVGIGTSYINPWIANAIYALVAIMWLIPDRRIERALKE